MVGQKELMPGYARVWLRLCSQYLEKGYKENNLCNDIILSLITDVHY